MNRDVFFFLGGAAAGAIGAALLIKHKDRMKPMAAELVAKAMNLKDRALDYAAMTREHAEDIVAEARHINESAAVNSGS